MSLNQRTLYRDTPPGGVGSEQDLSLRRCCGRFIDGEHLICTDILDHLYGSAGPAYLNGLCDSVRAQAEVSALVAGGEIAACSGNCDVLRAGGVGELDLSADAVAVAAMAHQKEREPVIRRRCLIV